MFAFAAGGAIIAYSLLELPPPTGPFAVGTISFTLRRPIESNQDSPGRFTLQLWYPSLESGKRASYGTGAGGWREWIYHRLVRTHSSAEAPPGLNASRVVVYVPAWGGRRTENTALAEELASYGYTVAAIDDLAGDSPVLDRLVGSLDLHSDQAYRASLDLAHARLAYEVQRASNALDYLERLNSGDSPGPFAGRLDTKRVGILGYSFGGAVALATCRRDRRFAAAMNLDGFLFGAGDGYSGGVPYFLVSDSVPLPTAAELTSSDASVRHRSQMIVADEHDQRSVLRYGGYELTVADTVHATFNDAPLYSPWQRLRAGWGNPPRIVAGLRQYALAFFDRALAEKPSALLTPGTRGRPAMTLAVGTTGATQ